MDRYIFNVFNECAEFSLCHLYNFLKLNQLTIIECVAVGGRHRTRFILKVELFGRVGRGGGEGVALY